MPRPSFAAVTLTAGCLVVSLGVAAPPTPDRLSLVAVDREPKEGREKPTPQKLVALEKAVADAPGDRNKRFDLVRALMAKPDLPGALTAAKAWREKDAYNLVVVRLVGDIYAELGQPLEARRAWSAIVELLPKDAEAHRALATVFKQAGDLSAAHQELTAATKIAPDDVRLRFELADAAHRLGKDADAERLFSEIVASAKAPEAVRYPAKQRLAQLWSAARRGALQKSDAKAAAALQKKIDDLGLAGGSINDLKVFLSWDSDRTDVDLWVETPGGEKVFYENKVAKTGEALFDDVTTGYGPESFTAKKARAGTYTIKVNYFGTTRTTFTEARGEVIVVLHEGTAEETRQALPYRLFVPKQTVTVAKVQVKP